MLKKITPFHKLNVFVQTTFEVKKMNANTYTHFKNQLLKMKEQAEANARILDDFQERSMKDATGELSFIDNHPSDYAFETERREVEGTLLRFGNEQIHHINVALEAIKNGTYGKCKVCKEEIPIERLEAIPETLFCKKHAQS